MQITPAIFKLNFNNYNNYNNTQYVDRSVIKPNYKNTLTKDTVCFTATSKLISESLWSKFEKELPALKLIATPFLDAAEAVAKMHGDSGVSFVRGMFEETAVKGADSKLSKVIRAKTFDDRDAIRTVMFVKNPYNLSTIFEKIIPSFGPESGRNYLVAPIKMSVGELMERGYIPIEEEKIITKFFEIPHNKDSHAKFFREIKNQKYDYYDTKRQKYDYDNAKKLLGEYLKTGKTPTREDILSFVKTLEIEVPDIDIRLKRDKLNLKSLPEKYKYSIGEPSGSYEDAQIRFIRYEEKDATNPIYHELLIHFGPTYSSNAFAEHKLVYEKLRLFKKLNIPYKKPFENSFTVDFSSEPEKGVGVFISEVKELFRRNVSEKLLKNGKNEDFFGNPDFNEPIYFSPQDQDKFERLYRNIIGFTKEYYKQAREKAQVSRLAMEQIEKDRIADITLLNKIKKSLDETIQKVNYEYGLKE